MRFREIIKAHTEQMRNNFNVKYIIADSAWYVAETLKEIDKFLWISRVPETLSLACDLIHATAPDLMSNPDQLAYCSLGTVYGDVKQRWVVVYSPQAYQRALKTVNKQCLSLRTAEFKTFDKLCKQYFACESDANKAITAFEKTLKMTFVANAQVTALPRYSKIPIKLSIFTLEQKEKYIGK